MYARRRLAGALITHSFRAAAPAEQQLLSRCLTLSGARLDTMAVHTAMTGVTNSSSSSLFGWPSTSFAASYVTQQSSEPGSNGMGDTAGTLGEGADGAQSTGAQGDVGDEEKEPTKERTTEELSDLLSNKEREVQTLRTQVEQLTDAVKRSLAEMENVRTRTSREMDNTRKYAVQNFAKSLFDVADVLERAISVVPPEALQHGSNMSVEKLTDLLRGLVDGLSGTEKLLLQTLKVAGVEQYNPVGEEFDPNLHNALFEVGDPSKTPKTIAVVTKKQNAELSMVAEIISSYDLSLGVAAKTAAVSAVQAKVLACFTMLQRGYKMHDRVVRPAEVGVVKA